MCDPVAMLAGAGIAGVAVNMTRATKWTALDNQQIATANDRHDWRAAIAGQAIEAAVGHCRFAAIT
jgi:hypothetical protein